MSEEITLKQNEAEHGLDLKTNDHRHRNETSVILLDSQTRTQN